MSAYKEYTIDELIEVLNAYKEKIGGDVKMRLSDFEYNGKQTKFGLSEVEDEEGLFIFYEMHEGVWE